MLKFFRKIKLLDIFAFSFLRIKIIFRDELQKIFTHLNTRKIFKKES